MPVFHFLVMIMLLVYEYLTQKDRMKNILNFAFGNKNKVSKISFKIFKVSHGSMHVEY